MNDFNWAKRLVCVAALGLCACGSGDRVESQGDGVDVSLLAEQRELAKVMVGRIEVRFLLTTDADGNERIWMQEIAPLDGAKSPMESLAFGEGLTALETFEALAAEGATTPVELAAAHAEQARALGRDDVDTVHQVRFDPNGLVPKTTASCDAWVFSTMSGSYQILNPDRVDWVSGTRIASTGWTNRNVTVGACNESTTASMTATPYWHVYDPTPEGPLFYEDIGPTWSRGTPFTLQPRLNVRWYNWRIIVNETCEGLVCTSTPMAYRVQGIGQGSNLYHLRAGEVVRRIR